MSGRGFGGVFFHVQGGRVVASGNAPPDPRRQLRGARATAAGAAFESWIEQQHLDAERLGLAHVRHVSPAVKVVGRTKRGLEVVITGKAGADYLGHTLAAPARPIVAEAKSTLDARLARSEVKPHQVADLDRCAAAGGVAVLLWELRAAGAPVRRFAAPWPVAWRGSAARGSIGLEELAPWELRPGECYLARLLDGASAVNRD
jgi:hypothetical protein